MEQSESAIHSFVIRIWLEETDHECRSVLWRGHITHIPSKKRIYFEELDSVIRFMNPYLKQTSTDADRAS